MMERKPTPTQLAVIVTTACESSGRLKRDPEHKIYWARSCSCVAKAADVDACVEAGWLAPVDAGTVKITPAGARAALDAPAEHFASAARHALGG